MISLTPLIFVALVLLIPYLFSNFISDLVIDYSKTNNISTKKIAMRVLSSVAILLGFGLLILSEELNLTVQKATEYKISCLFMFFLSYISFRNS